MVQISTPWGWPLTGEWAPREALFVKLLWPLVLVTSASELLVRAIRFSSVVFGVTSSLAVIHTIHGRLWLCIVPQRVWSVSRCRNKATVTGYHAWRLVVEYSHTRNKRKAGRKCDLQTTLQQLLNFKSIHIYYQTSKSLLFWNTVQLYFAFSRCFLTTWSVVLTGRHENPGKYRI